MKKWFRKKYRKGVPKKLDNYLIMKFYIRDTNETKAIYLFFQTETSTSETSTWRDEVPMAA